ncbi:class A beta-lactamase-related serine hydrolase [Corynebacterium sp. LK29]|uniref:class A beta-lactamase-related serine hydrolase n=1 Tax=Corynebacterium sp. LK29 TaxID=2044578 RepID=UPI00210338AF|nr:class A beta-lactamase-related serine hydrolase [Corynebacterium sp. LK29]
MNARHRLTPRPSRAIRMGLTGVIAVTSLPLAAGNVAAAPQPKLTPQGTIDAPGRTQISFTHTPSGTHYGTANENEARPGLSIVKLYIADYVFKHGTEADKAKATEMIRYSDDNIASELYGRYPDSINATAREYGLSNTHDAGHWGNSTTSSADTVKFLEAKKRENTSDPVLVAMSTASPVAADDYRQDYGTATLPGVIGTKWGWSDDRQSVHASASIGPDFSVAANTYGTKETHTSDVQNAFDGTLGTPSLPDIPGVPNLPESPNLGELLNLPETPQLPQIPGLPDFTGQVPSQF